MTTQRTSISRGLARTASVTACLLAAACMTTPVQPKSSAAPEETPSAALLAKMAKRPVTVKQLPTLVHTVVEPEPAAFPEDEALPKTGLLLASLVGYAGTAPSPVPQAAFDAKALEKKRTVVAEAGEAGVALDAPAKAEGKAATEKAAAQEASVAAGARVPFGAQKNVAVPRAGRMKGAVPWRHEFHTSKKGLGIGCGKCHHEAADGEPAACFKCHTAKGAGGVPDAKKAYHANCISCHRKAVAKDPSLGEKAPTSCGGCHRGPR